jgi:hypothetical protein
MPCRPSGAAKEQKCEKKRSRSGKRDGHFQRRCIRFHGDCFGLCGAAVRSHPLKMVLFVRYGKGQF